MCAQANAASTDAMHLTEADPNPEHKLLSDHSLIEIIRDPSDPTSLFHVSWRDGGPRITRLEGDGKIGMLPELPSPTYLRLPTGIAPYGSVGELVSGLLATFSKFVDLEEDDAFLLSLFGLASWFPDCVSVAPYAWVVGPPQSGKSTLLRLLQCFCRRAILIGDLRGAPLYKLTRLQPTMLLDEFEPDNSRTGTEMRRLLRTGNVAGTYVARNDQVFPTYCPKVLSSPQLPADPALLSRAILISLLPTDKSLPLLDQDTIERVAAEFQGKLLMFRMQNYTSIRSAGTNPEIFASLTPRVRDIARSLAAPLLNNQALEGRLLSVLEKRDQSARDQWALEPEWLTIEALFTLCHKPMSALCREDCSILVGGVARKVNEILQTRGEGIRLHPRRVGNTLRSLGLQTKTLGNLGRGLELTSAVRAQIHECARRLGFTRRHIATPAGLDAGYGGMPCELCEQLALTGGLRFVPVRTTTPLNLNRTTRRPLFADDDSRTNKIESAQSRPDIFRTDLIETTQS